MWFGPRWRKLHPGKVAVSRIRRALVPTFFATLPNLAGSLSLKLREIIRQKLSRQCHTSTLVGPSAEDKRHVH